MKGKDLDVETEGGEPKGASLFAVIDSALDKPRQGKSPRKERRPEGERKRGKV